MEVSIGVDEIYVNYRVVIERSVKKKLEFVSKELYKNIEKILHDHPH